MTDHRVAVRAVVGPVVASEVVEADRTARERSAVRVGAREDIVLVVRALRANAAVHHLAVLHQRRLPKDEIPVAFNVAM